MLYDKTHREVERYSSEFESKYNYYGVFGYRYDVPKLSLENPPFTDLREGVLRFDLMMNVGTCQDYFLKEGDYEGFEKLILYLPTLGLNTLSTEYKIKDSLLFDSKGEVEHSIEKKKMPLREALEVFAPKIIEMYEDLDKENEKKGRPKIMDDLQYWSEKLKNAVILEPEEPISKKFHLFLSGYVEKVKSEEKEEISWPASRSVFNLPKNVEEFAERIKNETNSPQEYLSRVYEEVYKIPYNYSAAKEIEKRLREGDISALIDDINRDVLSEGGVCRHKAILMTQLLEKGGIPSNLVSVKVKGSEYGHMLVEACVDGWNFYDPTVGGEENFGRLERPEALLRELNDIAIIGKLENPSERVEHETFEPMMKGVVTYKVLELMG